MSFVQYEEEIKKAIDNCTNDRLDRFCHDVISRMQSFIDFEDFSDLSKYEISVLEDLCEAVKNYPPNWTTTGKCLDYFTEIAEQDEDEDDFREFNVDFIEFLSALDSWRMFNETENKDSVFWVSESSMNILDNIFVTEIDIKRWLIVPEIKDEFNKQIMFLREEN